VLAAAFLGSGPLFLNASAGGKENVPELAFFTIAFWLVAVGGSRGIAAARWGGLALFALSLTVHEAGVTHAPFLAALHVVACRRQGETWRLVLGELAGFAVLLAIPLRPIAELFLRSFEVRSDAVTFLGLSAPALPWALRHLVTSIGEPILALSALGLAISAMRRDLVLVLAPMLLLFFYFACTNAYTPRHLLYLVLPVSALAGRGLAAAARRVGEHARHAIPVAIGLAVAACALNVVRALPRLTAHSHYLGTKAMALLVRERTEPDAIIVGVDDLPHVRYYAGRQTLPVPVGDDAAKIAFVRDLEARVKGGARVYLGSGYPLAYEDTPLLSIRMQQTFRLLNVAPVVNEWYHAAELEDASFPDALLRLDPR
jgi:hypothetical protein